MAGNASPQANGAQQNTLARALIIGQGVERLQQIYSNTFNAANQATVNINPRNVGLIKGFFVDVTLEVTAGATTPLGLTPIGAANVLSQIKFDDLQNNTRIQTAGWHLHFVNTARNQRPFGLCETLDTSPIAYGNNWDVISAPATVAGGATETITMRYYVPLAYSNDDLRGALYANVVNATMQLSLTVNQQAAVLASQAALLTNAVYASTSGANAPSVGNCTITVYQHYIDQLPIGPQGPILPLLDIQTIYELKNTAMTGISANQDYTTPYANFRTFLSTFAIYDNNGVLAPGTDINYWALRSANFTDIFKVSPEESALMSRLQIGLDFPDGTYYFNHRSKPINTIQYGNMELVLNAISPNAAARILVGYEDFAMINVVSGAGSLPAGG